MGRMTSPIIMENKIPWFQTTNQRKYKKPWDGGAFTLVG
jgi:hypothetical protein